MEISTLKTAIVTTNHVAVGLIPPPPIRPYPISGAKQEKQLFKQTSQASFREDRETKVQLAGKSCDMMRQNSFIDHFFNNNLLPSMEKLI